VAIEFCFEVLPRVPKKADYRIVCIGWQRFNEFAPLKNFKQRGRRRTGSKMHLYLSDKTGIGDPTDLKRP
jgi:hypothetical protein